MGYRLWGGEDEAQQASATSATASATRWEEAAAQPPELWEEPVEEETEKDFRWEDVDIEEAAAQPPELWEPLQEPPEEPEPWP
jgi:hypothetical protein